MTGNGQDYHGCQDRTRDGLTCQKWSEQYPHSHSFIVDWYPDAHLGDHNFCPLRLQFRNFQNAWNRAQKVGGNVLRAETFVETCCKGFIAWYC